ncbi:MULTISPECIES: FAD-binding protein [unclassified Leptolyngbya]|uniref:FAD-dependent oxidoreductase n=1 Tax=unclassified Leptolyngbya TaxID=2650499 RepID=UPI001F54F03B|nr:MULTISPECIES: FAD-binding protein [unclassified Leptolyngbya]
MPLRTDVLVIGGGPAGAWAAWSAASQGANVILVEKGYCGTSGATASTGSTVWYVPPIEEKRQAVIEKRLLLSGELADRSWMYRVLEQTHQGVHNLETWGYPFPLDDQGQVYRRSLQGPEYMRLMRRQVIRAGVKIFDHSPALELLVTTDGTVAGAAGIHRQSGERWTVLAGAVVIASGGCAFLSKALGCNVLTGDGYLMAAEAGSELSGMEFSNVYGIVAQGASVTKNAFFRWATFTTEDGSLIEGANAGKGRPLIARTLLKQPVYAQLEADERTKAAMRRAQPNFFLPFDRTSIDPFSQRFPITLRLEGTVRGTGGLRIVDESCATSVPGLYAAGDAASREIICGGTSGGGSLNAAWAISSGTWSGAAAARFAQSLGARLGDRPIFHLNGAGLTSSSYKEALLPNQVVSGVQDEVFPYDRNLFRSEQSLKNSISRLDNLWQTLNQGLAFSPDQALRAREAVAMTATARWMYNTALQRKESRGMHKREDYPDLDQTQNHRLISWGLDRVWVEPNGRSQSSLVKEAVAL